MTRPEECQKITTNIREDLHILTEEIATAQKQRHPLKLALNQQQIGFLSAWLAAQGENQAILTDSAQRRAQQLQDLCTNLGPLFNVKHNWHFIAANLSSQEQEGHIVSNLSQTYHHFLRRTPNHSFIIPATAAFTVPAHDEYHKSHLKIQVGEQARLGDVVAQLVSRGYIRYETTLTTGGLRVRGESIDIAPPAHEYHYTITWRGSQIEQIIRQIATDTKRPTPSVEVTSLSIPPVRLPQPTIDISDALDHLTVLRPSHLNHIAGQTTIITDALQPHFSFPLQPVTAPDPSHSTIILYENYDHCAAYAREHKLANVTYCATAAGRLPINLATTTYTLLSEAYLLPPATATKPISYQQGLTLVAQLTPGKPAVHSDHGIGIFEGLVERTINKQSREYLLLRYAAGDTLSVPVEYAHKVTAYLGETTPPLHRLGGTLWQSTRKKAQHDAIAFAKELLDIASRRAAAGGHSYDLSETIDHELEHTFPHTLTPDQARAWAEVKADLEQPQAMDRLIVGDVGFGKTEIALRAAYHAVANGKQVAILAPTTLLVQQHADTARQRLPHLNAKIGVLSRFATPTQQKNIRARIASGEISIAIGTHALLSTQTQWHNLGLVIIDEEQRFGVRHKEHFKKIRAQLDILSLSATPIPRTLSMALSGLKNLSIISTPPQGRKDITTHVGPDKDEVFAAALERELTRNGQAYVVAPKVRMLPSLTRRIQALIPTARIGTIHGQLPPAQLARIMEQFDTGDLDVLVASTIVENGLDVANANTIIVTHATHFGLSDLYQLRGRIGRRERQGYAYFLYNQAELTNVQRQRLTALTEAATLGSGWSLAQRDLEIRGAGNLLGAEQSGSVNAVGVQLYLDMVQEAMHTHSPTAIRRHDVDIELPLHPRIPEHYIADTKQRIAAYQRLARATTPTNLAQELTALTEHYGPLPAEVKTLELIVQLQHAAAAAGISHISYQTIEPSDEEPYHRLILRGPQLPHILRRVGALGNWVVRGTALTWDLDTISPAIVKKLIDVLQ